jgi:ABC-2 type transport system ATP-binding protein
MRPRDLQAQLLAEPAVIDAVPESGEVRVVTQAGAAVAARPTQARFEDGFVVLLHQSGGNPAVGPQTLAPQEPQISGSAGDRVVDVHDLVRRFGKFVAVNRANFFVKRGEIFGLLGPNGAGKTTTTCATHAPRRGST